MDELARGPRLSKAERKAARLGVKVANGAGVPSVADSPKESSKAERKAARSAAKVTQDANVFAGAELQSKATMSELIHGPERKRKRKTLQASEVVSSPLSPKEFRSKHGIEVSNSGLEVPPIQTLDALATELGGPIVRVMREQGYTDPTPIQSESWPWVIQGRDVVAVASTGSGKTCAFLLPIVARIAARSLRSPARKPVGTKVVEASGAPEGAWTCPACGNVNWPKRLTCNTRSCGTARPELGLPQGASATPSNNDRGRPAEPLALVLAPTRELAQQIQAEAMKFAPVVGARVVCLYGGVPKGPQADELAGSGADIVVATPGRCVDFLRDDAFLGTPLRLAKVTYLVLDEADRMLEAGFLEDMRKIASMCAQGPVTHKVRAEGCVRQTLFFTATWPEAVQKAAREFAAENAVEIRVAQRREVGKVSSSRSVKQYTEVLESHRDKFGRLGDVLLHYLPDGGACLVFCKTKSRCDWMVKRLLTAGNCDWARAIHSDKKQKEREETLECFRSRASTPGVERSVLVATNIAARGLHIAGVPLVVIYDFGSVADYVHQVGRTGRAGAEGNAVLFYVSGDGEARSLASVLAEAGQKVPKALKSIMAEEPEEASEGVSGACATTVAVQDEEKEVPTQKKAKRQKKTPGME